MELSQGQPLDIHLNKGKLLEQLSPVEQQQFIADAIAEKDKFFTWEKQQKTSSSINSSNSWKNAPSKNFLIAAVSAAVLANVGITIAGDKAKLSDDEIWKLWQSSLGYPVLEELVFRSRSIPRFLSWIKSKHGSPIREDKARFASNTFFALGHTLNRGSLRTSVISGLNTFGGAGFYQKLANEHGLSASTAAHILWDTSLATSNYLIQHYGNKIPENKIKLFKYAYMATFIGTALTKGIIGIKEMVDDKKINDMLAKLRTTPQGQVISNQHEIDLIAQKLLKIPSTDGYKFHAGVELAYTNAALSMPDILKDTMTPDEYAKTQVYKTVTEVWKDPKTLPYRLEKANRYITEQIAARKTN